MSVKLRTKKLKDGGESFYLDIYYKGVRRYEFLSLALKKNDTNKKQIKELAEKIRSQKELEIHANAHNLPNYYHGENDLLKFYDAQVRDKSYRSSLNKFKEFSKNKLINGRLPFNKVDDKFCEDYKKWLLERIGNNTTWVYIYKLKAVLNKAIKQKIIHYNPCKYVSIKNIETERVYLTFDEVKKLSETPCDNSDVKRAFLFSCYTGLRSSDIKALTWGQIREGKIFFRQQKTKGVEYLPLNETALKIVYSGLESNVIPLPEMKVFNISSRSSRVGEILRIWGTKAGINKYLTFHTSRHTFATISLTYGVDLYTVSKLLGHRDIKTTEIYAKIVNEKLNEAVSKLPALQIK